MPASSLPNPPWTILRARLSLRPAQAVQVPPHQAAVIYALLCDAHARSTRNAPAMPDGVLLNAPDQAVRWITPQQPLGVGITIIAPTPRDARATATEVYDGLRSLGRNPAERQRLKRFQIDCLKDVVAQANVQSAGQLQPISPEHYQHELDVLRGKRNVTLRFTTPLRCSLPKRRRTDGHRFMDDTCFPAETFLARVRNRLQQLGCAMPPATANQLPTQVAANELVWLDIGYGSPQDRKTLGGAVGRLALENVRESDLYALVLGQYVRAGENTRFGFGEYRIEELGDDPFAIARTQSLLQLAQRSGDEDRVAGDMDLPSGVLSQALASVRNGCFEAEPHFRVAISKPTGGTRTLCIPSLRDRAVQRVLLPVLTDGIDGFLESSSMAYRRGLGRSQAARRIRQAARDGYAWAVKADFYSFFDNVSHQVLRRRLDAYLACEETVDWIMNCIRAGSPQTDCGLPTGAPLSPLLANLFLDQFDEEIHRTHAQLIRYADDFLILCKTREEADRLFATAHSEAQRLLLELNRDKSTRLKLRDGFCFLGFQFQFADSWHTSVGEPPQLVEQLNWTPAKRPIVEETGLLLPGESQWDPSFRQSTLLVSEDYTRIRLEGKNLVLESKIGKPPMRFPIRKIRELIVHFQTWVDWNALRQLSESGCEVVVVDAVGRLRMEVASPDRMQGANAVIAQVQLLDDAPRRLQIARELIGSKLHNYAVLATHYLPHPQTAPADLFRLSERAREAPSPEVLLGIEGAGAGLWYGRFAEALARDFEFHGRVAPDATDPVNAMLNMGQTMLHRWLKLWIERTGLVASLGALHGQRPGHAALASDLQEPFRHLIDRSVIELTRRLRSSDFVRDPGGPFPLRMATRARLEALATMHRNLSRAVVNAGDSEPRSYVHQMRSLVLGYRSLLLDPQAAFRSFWHPTPHSLQRVNGA